MAEFSQRLSTLVAPAQDYWQGMPAKDRRALSWLAVIIIPVAVIWGGILPAKQALESAAVARHEAVSLAATIRRDGPRLRGGSSARVPANELAQRVQALAASQTIALDRLESDPAGVRIAINNASVTQLTLFLQQCRAQGISVKEVVINRGSDNSSQVRVRLSV
ncbi:type II secretory pathway component PulM [Paraperlucidibaca baekdonensis]|uniref:Type II secretory pathway component PulM n=1 Tax=Paraperlucidibaca baekdonensis TaxID=748120 RepID=A0A3E0H1U8_9GAMM|nr:type II secretion system protein GspM [Paraperlucidibaca baekdonensis]REH36836.1 type II secretory pathway component PulM [Paraperlucidibaca baekdonensis]